MSKLQYERMLQVEGMMNYLEIMNLEHTARYANYCKRHAYYLKLWIKDVAKRAR